MVYTYVTVSQQHTPTPTRFIFDHHGKRFFRCMSKIYGWQRAKQIRTAENYNVGKPASKRRRVPYWKQIAPDPCESSDTVSTSSGGDDKCPFFERSQKVTPHGMVHFADQVVMGGTHSFHNTAAAESRHPRCIAQAALRSRTYHDVNLSGQKMLEYLIDKNEKQKIIDFVTQETTQDTAVHHVIPAGYHWPLLSLSLTSPIRISSRLATVLHGRRRGLTSAQRLHQDTWHSVLCEGVPLSIMELVQTTVDHLGLVVNMDNSRRLLDCDWKLGWRVSTTTKKGTNRIFRGGGGYSQNNFKLPTRGLG